jgi:hypothetical protein
LIGRTLDAGHVQFDWVSADEGYGRNGDSLNALEAGHQRYVVKVPVSTTVCLSGPASTISVGSGQVARSLDMSPNDVLSVEAVAQRLPADAWHSFQFCTLGDLHIDQRIALGKKVALGDVW